MTKHCKALNTRRRLKHLYAGDKVVQIGTSLTDNGYQLPEESASRVGPSGRGADAWTRFLTNQVFDWVNKGVSGNQIEDMIARFETDVADENPDIIILEAGTNNASMELEALKTKYLELYKLAEDTGATVIVYTVAMRESSSWTNVVRDKMLNFNQWLMNFPYAIEINKYFTDPATKRPYADFTDDGTHWTYRGAYAVARAVAEGLVIVGSRNVFKSMTVNSNPLLKGSSGSSDNGITGTVPDGFHLDIEGGHSGTAVSVARDPGMEMTFTPGGSSTTEVYSIRTNPLDTVVTIDKVYELLADIEFSEWDGWDYYQLRLYDPGSSAYYDLLENMQDDTHRYPSDAVSGIMRTPPYTAVDTGLRIYLQVGVKPDATGTGKLTLKKYQLQEVIDPLSTSVTLPSATYTNDSPVKGLESVTDFDGDQGVVYFRYTDTAAKSGSGNPVIMTISDGGSSNRVFIQKRSSNGGRFRVASQSSGQTSEIWDGYLTSFANGSQEIAVGWDKTAQQLRIWANGMLLCKIVGNWVNVTFSDVDIAQLQDDALPFTPSSMEQVKYYDKLLSDEQGQLLTRSTPILSGVSYDHTKDIWMFLGQSNSEGQGAGSPVYTNADKMSLLAYDGTVNSYSDPFADEDSALVGGLGSSTSGVSSAGFFADELAELSERNIMVCPSNKASTSFEGGTATWSVNSNSYRTTGSKISGMMATATATCHMIRIAQQYGHVKGMIWQQGEGDVAYSVSETNYELQQVALINMIKMLHGGSPKWYNCSMPSASTWAPSQTAWDNIDNAQQGVANDNDDVYYVNGCDILGASGDRVHHDTAGLETVGRLTAARVFATAY